MSNRVLKECPSLPISGRRGSETLQCLRRRADFLKARIEVAANVGKNLDWDKGELGALNWVIQRIIELEEELYNKEIYIQEHSYPISDPKSVSGD